MDAARNPFAPGAGSQPPELTGRSTNLESARVALERVQGGKDSRGIFLIGLRGVGKTVLLNRINGLADSLNFRTAFIETPEGEPLAELLVPHVRKILLEMDLIEGAKDKVKKAIAGLRAFASAFDIQIGEIGIGVKPPAGMADSGKLDKDLTDLLILLGEAAKEAGTGVAICIDELQYIDEKELGALLAAVHRINQLRLPLIIFGAGLPQLTGLSGKAKSYAERLFEFQKIDRLSERDACLAVREPIEDTGAYIDDRALKNILDATEGYPYFLQEWGYHAWNAAAGSPITAADVARAHDKTIEALDEGFFRVRFDRLTPLEKEYMRAMAELGKGSHRSGEIAQAMGRTVDNIAPTRSGVIAKGMVYAPSYGDNAFTVPKFDEYMLRVMPVFTPTPPRTRARNKRGV